MSLLCLECGTTTDLTDLDACPGCGDSKHVPADTDDVVTVTTTRHELRILTFWADNWARANGCERSIRTVLDRLALQTDTALTFSQEIADLRAAFPGSEVRVVSSTGEELEL